MGGGCGNSSSGNENKWQEFTGGWSFTFSRGGGVLVMVFLFSTFFFFLANQYHVLSENLPGNSEVSQCEISQLFNSITCFSNIPRTMLQ